LLVYKPSRADEKQRYRLFIDRVIGEDDRDEAPDNPDRPAPR
jgi:hypothetical protein